LTSFIPSNSPSADSSALDSQVYCNPKSAIVLHSIQIECLSIQQNLRPEDQNIGLWEIFGKYLNTYIRRTQSPDMKRKRERYFFAGDLVRKAQLLLAVKDPNMMKPSEVSKTMSWAASDANLIEESTRWTEEWLSALVADEEKPNTALIALCKVRLAVMELKAIRLSVVDSERFDSLAQRVEAAAIGLENVSRGRKQDLETLLNEVGQFRRSSLPLIASLLDGSPKITEPSSEGSRQLRDIWDRITKSVIHFCRKYVATGISEEELQQLQSVLLPAVDSVLSASWRAFDVGYEEAWGAADALLSECWSAIKSFEKIGDDEIDETFYLKVSNAYWQIFLLCRKVAGSDNKTVRALRKSISALEDRPPSELMKASVSLKWELLGSLFLALGDHRRAEEAFLASLRIAAITGYLNSLGDRVTDGVPLWRIVASPEREISSIGRALSGLIKISSNSKDGKAANFHFKDLELSVSSRGLLLEWTLYLASDAVNNNAQIVRVLGEELLSAYHMEEMPIRRSRVIARLLEISVDHPQLLNVSEVRILGEEVHDWATMSPTALDEDQNLLPYLDDLLACCYVGLAFSNWQEGTPRPDLISKALGLWNSIIEQLRIDGDLRDRASNTKETIRRLSMIVEFFDMKGDNKLKLATLKLLGKIRKHEQPVDHNGILLP
jgi:separase